MFAVSFTASSGYRAFGPCFRCSRTKRDAPYYNPVAARDKGDAGPYMRLGGEGHWRLQVGPRENLGPAELLLLQAGKGYIPEAQNCACMPGGVENGGSWGGSPVGTDGGGRVVAGGVLPDPGKGPPVPPMGTVRND